jgi:hypothetical protein
MISLPARPCALLPSAEDEDITDLLEGNRGLVEAVSAQPCGTQRRPRALMLSAARGRGKASPARCPSARRLQGWTAHVCFRRHRRPLSPAPSLPPALGTPSRAVSAPALQVSATLVLLTKRTAGNALKWIILRIVLEFLQVGARTDVVPDYPGSQGRPGQRRPERTAEPITPADRPPCLPPAPRRSSESSSTPPSAGPSTRTCGCSRPSNGCSSASWCCRKVSGEGAGSKREWL